MSTLFGQEVTCHVSCDTGCKWWNIPNCKRCRLILSLNSMYVILCFYISNHQMVTDCEQQYIHCAKESLQVSTHVQQAVSCAASLSMQWIQYTTGSEWNCTKICNGCLSIACLAGSEWKCLYLNHTSSMNNGRRWVTLNLCFVNAILICAKQQRVSNVMLY